MVQTKNPETPNITLNGSQCEFTNLSRLHRDAKRSVTTLIETLVSLESQLVQLPESWLLLNIDTPKGAVLSLVTFPSNIKAINKASLREWIIHEITRTALTQSCYHCEAAFQPRASNAGRLYMWCTRCGFSCFNWKQE